MERKKLVRKAEPLSKVRIRWPRWTGFHGRTAWDWMHLLIVPLVLTGIGLAAQQVIANLRQDVRQQQIEDQRAQRAVLERALAEPQAQNEVLQAYLDVMKDLLLEQDLRDSGPDSSARAVANVQTLHTLERVDGVRKRVILRLLADSHLIDADTPLIHLDRAALQEVDAEGMDLSDTDLSRANLEGATLFGADLRGVNLSGAEGITNELEQQAASLEGATMPNGQKYEDWLTSKDRAEDGWTEEGIEGKVRTLCYLTISSCSPTSSSGMPPSSNSKT